MKKLIFALSLSLIIHMLFLLNFKDKVINEDDNGEDKKIKSTNIKYVKLTPPKITPKPKPEQKLENIPATTPPKKVVKQEFKKVTKVKPQTKREKAKEPQKIEPIPKKQVEVSPNISKPIAKQKEQTALQKEQKKLQEDNLSSFLQAENFEAITPNRDIIDTITQSYLDLYGEEYSKLNQKQKIYLKNNLRNIVRITEYYLRYPSLAAKLRQSGTNVVEFYLHPNGDISELKLINSSGSKSLDENSIDTIWIAYKDYPRPEEKTKIKIYINYYLY